MSSWIQKTIVVPEQPRGIHLITDDVVEALPELATFKVGLLHVFIKHTSASIAINENASPDVRSDLNKFLDNIVPDGFRGFEHTIEGPDDMPAHVKAAMLGNSVTVPVSQGQLLLGTWQGIYLCEHRNRGGRRRLVLTLMGDRDWPD